MMNKALVFKLVKTTFLIATWACLGLFSEITGVTLQDLRERTQSDYEAIGQAVSMRMAGYGAGAIFGGWLMDKLNNFGDLVIAISLTLAALMCTAIAHTPYVELLFVEFTVQGVMETCIAIAGQQSLVHLWKEKSSGPMHALHLGYGAGSFLVPQIAKPFLSQRMAETSSKFFINNCQSESTLNTTNITVTDSVLHNVTTTVSSNVNMEESNFEYGYYIVMCIILVVAFVYYSFFCCNHRQIGGFHHETPPATSTRTFRQIFNFNSCSPGHPWYAAGIFLFLVLWFYIAVGGQMIFANYLYSYCRDMMCLEKGQSANMQSTFWIGFTMGRFSGFVAALWLPMKYLIFIEAFGNMLSALVLYFNPADITVIWIFSCISGLFVGPLYPTGIAWANRYLTMTGLAYTITLVGGSLAGVSFTVAIGWYFEHHGPGAMWYFVIGYSAVACVTATLMHLIARTRGDKYQRDYHHNEECDAQLSAVELADVGRERTGSGDGDLKLPSE